jgi:hypothetical protein
MEVLKIVPLTPALSRKGRGGIVYYGSSRF